MNLKKLHTGLAICSVLAVADLASIGSLGSHPKAGEQGPPAVVTIASFVLGVITLVAMRAAWRRNQRGLLAVRSSRVVSAILAVPSLFVPDIPIALRALGIAIIALTAAAFVLVGSPSRAAKQPSLA